MHKTILCIQENTWRPNAISQDIKYNGVRTLYQMAPGSYRVNATLFKRCNSTFFIKVIDLLIHDESKKLSQGEFSSFISFQFIFKLIAMIKKDLSSLYCPHQKPYEPIVQQSPPFWWGQHKLPLKVARRKDFSKYNQSA